MVSGSRLLGIAAVLLVVATGCGRVTSHFSSHDTSRKGTLAAVPPSGPVGTAFALQAGGLKPGEAMTFEVDPPKGNPFIGPPHTAGPDGTVSSTFTPQAGDTPGTYKLKATGDMGTRATGTLVIQPGPPPTTTTTTTIRRHR
jgi:hypothetical protein